MDTPAVPVWFERIPWAIIREVAQDEGLSPPLTVEFIGAVIMVESGGNSCTARYEPKWKYAYDLESFARPIRSSIATEKQLQSMSLGIMQVMGTVARELGHRGWLTELCRPEIGIKYGILKLKQLAKKHSNLSDIAAAYNAGKPTVVNGEYVVWDHATRRFIRHQYVYDVMNYYHQLTAP